MRKRREKKNTNQKEEEERKRWDFGGIFKIQQSRHVNIFDHLMDRLKKNIFFVGGRGGNLKKEINKEERKKNHPEVGLTSPKLTKSPNGGK